MIEVRNLSKVYQSGEIAVEALKKISFTIEDGEMVAIVGPSGSGKSTLMNLLGCLDTPTSGSYFLDSTDVSKANDDELAEVRNNKIGFVFQKFNLLARDSILHNVETPLIYAGIKKKERKERATSLLNKVGLADRLDHNPNEVSGGQRQRVAIARALVNNPSLILADEPTGNLDSKTEAEIIDLFHELNSQGHTIVIVTHSEKVAQQTNRIIHILDGELVKDEVVLG
ncbi:putative ABC transport system ATP-binding protein [Orenia metallireducens]|uniref:Putative ABC transport system ATP-binding protein n=1 Tax=Orenia metallireducens TaxID=1413210 RepID=A0A285F415_9FIRM|nr:ABC transporter ATP-binding protein [Orenia metallireducens]PRX34889.1 putative ABC transport system ATP-binding protein [Orenia metallireducens]SNY06059.1 putative ABC transport system ATP-binding protein [Orenia metallireducens]